MKECVSLPPPSLSLSLFFFFFLSSYYSCFSLFRMTSRFRVSSVHGGDEINEDNPSIDAVTITLPPPKGKKGITREERRRKRRRRGGL